MFKLRAIKGIMALTVQRILLVAMAIVINYRNGRAFKVCVAHSSITRTSTQRQMDDDLNCPVSCSF